ncbi:unnamed protein product [Cuscuta campestris]|uniref:Uncharacterized protein n=1 Tax=Cuscuta campestris TaxID=132261 RepID=A0A484M1U0_9ASTE|nr:unnamed protein product [Cuscuta campestris]
MKCLTTFCEAVGPRFIFERAADGSFVRRSATSMLNGKKAVQAAPINKKVVPAKPGVSKKGNGAGQLKLSKSVDVEDVEPEDMSLDILRAE